MTDPVAATAAPESVGARTWQRLAAADSPWPWIAVAVLAIVPHLGVLSNPFAFDDWSLIPGNPLLVHPHAIRKFFSENLMGFLGRVGISGYYRPLQHLLNYVLFHLFGPHPGGFHAVGLLLHAGVSLLVFAVVRKLSRNHAAGFVAALLFAVHPAHTEVIAWISSASDLLCTLFTLLAVLCYLRSVESRGVARWLLLAALAVSTLCAELTKETGVMVPLFLVLYEWLVERRGARGQLRARWREYAATAAATAVYFAARFAVLGGLGLVRQKSDVPWPEHVWTAVGVFYRYLALLFWPVRLNFFLAYPVSRHPWEPVVLAGFLSMAAVVALGWWLYRQQTTDHGPRTTDHAGRSRVDVLAVPMCLLPVLPLLQLPYLPNGILMVERAVYLPSVGFCWLAALALLGLRKRMSWQAVAAVILVVITAFSVRSALRIEDWKDETGLCQEGIALAPGLWYLHGFTGEVLLRHDRPMEAVVSLREAIRLRSSYTDAHNFLGQAYWRLRQPEAAVTEYARAAQLSMADNRRDAAARAWNNIGVVFRAVNRLDEAVAAYRRALELDETFSGARNNLGFALLLQGRLQEAIGELEETVRQNPAIGQAHANLGLAYAASGRRDEARAALGRAELIMPESGEVQARIGQIELAGGKPEEARRRFERALVLEPDNPRAQAGLAALETRH